MSIPSRHLPALFLLIAIVVWLVPAQPDRAMDLTDGLMYAVPAPKGAPSLDGTDAGWDLSAVEPMWVDPQTAKLMHAKYALNYDSDNLYVYARLSLPNRKLTDPNGPDDTYWFGDMIEFRVCSDPSMRPPLNVHDPVTASSNRIAHMSFWKDTATGQSYFGIGYGDLSKTHGKALNPPGSKVAITEGATDYVIQAVVPWSVLNVPGGKNPFAPGSRMTAIWNIHWGPESSSQFAALYTQNPATAAYIQWDKWGQVEFSPTGNLKSRHPTMEEILADLTNAPPVGVPITIDVPNAGKLLLAGLLRVQGNFNGFTGIVNSGTLTIRGDQVVMERLPGSSVLAGWYDATINSSQILNQPGGLLQGSGTLTYLNSTANKEGRYLQVTNLGTIAPGVHTAQGEESFGPLILHNVNVRFGTFTIPPRPLETPASAPLSKPIPATPPQPGILQIGIGGPSNAPDRYDTLTLAGSDDVGQLELIKGEGNTLNIVPLAGVTPHGTYRIVTAASVVGTFDTLQYNGAAQVPYIVNYLPDGIEVVFP